MNYHKAPEHCTILRRVGSSTGVDLWGCRKVFKMRIPSPTGALWPSWGSSGELEFPKDLFYISLFKEFTNRSPGRWEKEGELLLTFLSSLLFSELVDSLEKSQILSGPGPMLRAAWAVSPDGWMDVEAVTPERLLWEDTSRTLSFAC